jgi:hypothetical protein
MAFGLVGGIRKEKRGMFRNNLIRFGVAPLFALFLMVINAGADVLFYDFSSQPPNTRFLDPTPSPARPEPRIEGGILKLTDANDPGNFAGFAIGPFPTVTINALQATWKSRLGGGGGGGADGYSFSIGTDLADNFQGEEGTGTGLSVNIDTFDNGVALDPAGTGLEIKWGGAIVASTHVNKDNGGDGVFLRKDTFVDASVTVSPSGAVAFVYDGVTLAAQIPGFTGLPANQYIFGARTGGANDNQWIDDLRIVTQTPDSRLITPEGATWLFNDTTLSPGLAAGWELPSYDPNSVPGWRPGTALFGNDSAGIYDAATQPFAGRGTNGFETPLDRTGGRVTFYFRTTFNWSGPTAGVTLISSNWVDDGQVVYLNGTEVSRLRVPAGPLTWDTLGSNPGTEGLVEVQTWDAAALVEGQNTVAVELHQSGTASSDVAFALGLTARAPIPPTIVNAVQPTNRTVFANRSTTFTVEAIGSPAVTYQWYKDGSPIDPLANATATTSSLVISNVQDGDAGGYFARVANSLGSVDSRTATLTVLPAVPLKVLRAFGSLNLQAVTVVFDQFVDATSATDPFNYEVPGFGIDPTIVLNADGQSVTLKLDAVQAPGANYCVNVSGVLSGAQLPLDPNPTTVCYQTFVVSCGFAVQENYNGIGGVLLADLEASPKYPGAPDLVRYRSFAGINTADEFDNYGARLSGFVIPPVSGNYVFYLAADDQGDLWLSTDSSPANLVKIADEPVWSGRRTWTGAAGGGGRDGASVSGGPQQNISGPIPLVAGQMYYFQARMKEGGGGDNLDIAWQLPGELPPLNGSPSIPAVYLASLADPANASLTINTQPQDQRIVLSPGGGAGQPLLAQNFNAGDGGFTVDTPQAFNVPWTYNAASGSWQVNQDGAEVGHPMTSRLRSGALTVTQDGALQLSFNHRYSFEQSGGNWDGGQVRISVNGGAYTTVPASAFTAGGYNGTVIAGNSVIQTQQGFVQNSAGHQTPAFITSTANLGFFYSGDVVQLEFLYGGDTNTRGDFVPSWEIDNVTLTEGIAAQQPARFVVSASAVVGGNPSSAIFYQWERNCGSGFTLIPGANAATYSFEPRLADNGCKFRVRMYVPGATALSAEATLTVVQPNTPPSFTCGPAPAAVECGGASVVSVPNWATDIQVHSITRQGTSFSSDFSSMPAGTRLIDPSAADGVTPRIEDGVLKLSNAENLGVGGLGGFGIGPFPVQTFDTIDMTWKSRVGGGGNGGADGYSINIGNDLVDSFTAEEGTGTGISVTVDTFDNGTGLDVGIDFKWRGNRVAYIPLPKDDDGSGNFLRKDTFVDASMSVTASGAVTLTYDGNVTAVQLPNYAGVSANQVILLAREGGANDRHWIDDLSINAFPADASSAEAAQTVHFNVSNDNPSLFSVQPAVSPNGTLTYTLAAGASGSANVTVVAQDNGGTADGGRDTSTACTFVVRVGDTTPPTVSCPANITVNATSAAGAVVTYIASGADSCGAATVVCAPASGSTFPVGTATVTCTATDRAGLTATCSFTVTVNAFGQPPVAIINSEQLIDLSPEFENPVLLSCNWWNACLVADGFSSSGAEPLTYLWFLEGDPTPIGAGPIVTNCLEVGEHTIILVVTDRNGLTAEARKTIEVVTAPLAIDLLIEQINEAHKHGVLLSRKTKRELIATLQVALNHASNDRLRATQQALDAFEKKVRASLEEIGAATATAWIRWSQAVSAGMEKCIKPPRKPKDHHDEKKDADDDKR